jgi:LCP family protein required for cell wall assembly
MVNHKKSSRPTAWPTRALALILLAALLIGCTAPAAEDIAAGRLYTPLQDPAATISAQSVAVQAASSGLANGTGRTIAISYPAASASVTNAFPLVATPDAPMPPIAPPRLGQMVTAIEMEHAQEMAAAEAAAAELAPPDPNAPKARVPTTGGDPFDWSTSENFLVLGTDRRAEGGSWRTDSIMVIGLDRAKERAAVFSVPRDLYVQIPGYGWGRINQADYMGERRTPDGGGPALVSSILEEHLGITTQHWVRIQMDGFVQFVDAMGGVDVYLDCPFAEPILNLDTNSWTNFTLPAGMNHLDGQDAYWFARLRLRESDIGRSSRQRAIIWALREQILSTNAILRLPQLYSAFRDTISTDLSLFDIIGLAQFGVSLKPENVRAGGLTLKDLQDYTTAGGAQVLIIGNPTRVRELVANVWDQPAMADAYRKDGSACEGGIPAPEPEATPLPETGTVPPVEPTPQSDATPEAAGAVGGFAAAAGASTAADFNATPAPLSAIIVDPVTGALFDAATGYPIDPTTGLPYDPVTGEGIAPVPNDK